MKCPNCQIEITLVRKWRSRYGTGGKIIGGRPVLAYYECPKCGLKLSSLGQKIIFRKGGKK